MADIVYRPRSASEILDAAIHLLRQHYRAFVTMTAVAYLPLMIFTLIFAKQFGLASPGAPPQIGFATFIILPIQMVWFGVMSALVSTMASRAYLQEPIDPGTAWKVAIPRLPAAIGSTIIVGVFTSIGLVFFVVPGLYMFSRYGISTLVAVIEGTSLTQSLSRASTLSRDRKLHILLVTFLAIVIYIVVSIGIGVGALLMPSLLLRTVFSYVGTVLTWPLVPVIQTTLYYDLRIRAEGYDVELMSRQLETPFDETTRIAV